VTRAGLEPTTYELKVRCGGLLVRGNFQQEGGNPATDGVYDLEWLSLEDKTNISGDAPFVIRNHLLREIARVTYQSSKTNRESEPGNNPYKVLAGKFGAGESAVRKALKEVLE